MNINESKIKKGCGRSKKAPAFWSSKSWGFKNFSKLIIFKIYIGHLHLVPKKRNDTLIDKNQMFQNFENENQFGVVR